MISTIGNLYTLLNNTGLQSKDNATYLLLKGILDGLTGINTDYATLSGVPPNIFGGTNSFEKIVDLDSGQLHFPQIQNPSIDINTLDDYREGNWTPVDVGGGGLIYTFNFPSVYIKIGRLVYIEGDVIFPVNASANNAFVGGLPFPVAPVVNQYSMAIGVTTQNTSFTAIVAGNVTPNCIAFSTLAGAVMPNSSFSGKEVRFGGCYISLN